jgi:hypothetical protein
MSAPFVCPACGAAADAAPCPRCGHVPPAGDDSLPIADETRAAIPVAPPPERRRRRPLPPLVTEAQVATGIRWAIILSGFMVIVLCLALGALTRK